MLWALRRWGVREVRLEGRASSDGDGPAPLAGKRANLVSDLLLRDGVQVFEAVGRYPYPGQAQIEDAVGKHAMRTVLVLPRNSELIDTGESPLGENTDPAATVRPASPGPERTATSGADAGNGTTSIPDSTTNDAAASSADTPALPASGGDAAGARPDEPAEAAPTDDEGSDRDTGTAADGGNDGNQDRAADEDPPADAGDIDVTDTSAGKDDVGRATTVATPGSQSPSSLAAAPPSQQAVSPDDDAHPDRVDPEQFDPEQAKAADATPDVADAATPLSGQAMPSEAQDAGVVDSIAPAETATDGDARGRPVDPDPDAQHD